jgi:hypothetical protein
MQSRAANPPLAPAHEDAGAQHLVRLGGGSLVPVRVLAVCADAVAKLYGQRAVSERRRVGAAECARPLGVGVHAFGELEFFVREAGTQHEFHSHAVTQGLMRHEGVKLLEGIVVNLQLGFKVVFIYPIGKLVRGCVSGRRRASIRETNNVFPPSLSRDTHLHSLDSPSISLHRRGLPEPRHRMRNVSIHSSPVVVAHSHEPLRILVSSFGCLAPPFHGGGPVLRNAPVTGGVDHTAPFLRTRDTLLCGHLHEPQCLCPSRRNHVIVSRGALQNIQPEGTQEMEVSQLVLAACVSPVRGAHGVIPPRQERVSEGHRGVAALLLPLYAESKPPKARDHGCYTRGEWRRSGVELLERESPSNPTKGVIPTGRVKQRGIAVLL